MKKNVAIVRESARGAPGREGMPGPVRRAALVTLIAIACLGMASCLGDRYVRDWTYHGVDLADTLVVIESTFSLERVSVDGIEFFSGRFKAGEGLWRFEIDTWKPAGGEERHFDPPVVFVCRGRLFQNGIAFFSGRFLGKAPMVLFIRTPTDFDRVD